MNGKFQHIIICVFIVLRAESCFVDITYVDSAVPKGGVCLDGSPPAYHLDKGSGAGTDNWLIHIEGGGWCNNVTTCLALKQSRLGSSKQMAKRLAFFGIISKEPQFNPDFYNWNRVVIRYCDGSSFTGDIEAVDPVTRIYYRGARVFLAVIEDLLAKGMKNGKNIILNGCSAGGLATIFHCDRFKALLPKSTKVKCFSDGGFFINVKDVSGAHYIEDLFDEVVTTHGSAKILPESCTSKMKPSLCFFPQHAAQEVETPIFFLNAAYDAWQIRNIWAPGVADPHGLWDNCKDDIRKCSTTQLQFMQGFRLQFVNAFSGLGSSPSRGYFINSCYAHCQTEMQETWFKHNSPVLNNKTIAIAFGDWFFNRSPFQKIDCAFPCDKTCNNLVFSPKNHSLA